MSDKPRILRSQRINHHGRAWAIINGNGPLGDAFVATNLDERDAMIVLQALLEAEPVTVLG